MNWSGAARIFSLALFAGASVAAVVSCSPNRGPAGLQGLGDAVPTAGTDTRANAKSSRLIYIANMAGMPNGGTVTVYSATGKPLRTLSNGITSPTAFAFDKHGNVYVLNSMPASGSGSSGSGSGSSGSGGSVSVYTRGGKKFLRQITSGITAPVGLALDSGNNVYVANAGSSSAPGNVVVFKAGTTNVVATITKGISFPTEVGTDCSGKLYVLNGGNNSVTEYGGRKHKLMLTVQNMTISTGLMVTCQGNLFVSQSTSTSAIKRRPLSATPTPSASPSASPAPTPYSTPGGSVTEFAAGSAIPLDTMTVAGGVPCSMASDPNTGMTWVEACPFSGTTTATLYGYPADQSEETAAIVLPAFSANAAFVLYPLADGVIQQTTLAVPRTSTTGYDRKRKVSSAGSGELLFYDTSGNQTGAVPEATLGVAVAIASN
jgi:hypothetical protein